MNFKDIHVCTFVAVYNSLKVAKQESFLKNKNG